MSAEGTVMERRFDEVMAGHGLTGGRDHVYEPLLGPIRHEPVTVLQLSYGQARVEGLRDYFDHHDARVHSIDYNEHNPDDPDLLTQLYLEAGKFDVIRDAASSMSSVTVATFNTLWPCLKPGGLYLVDDIAPSYNDHLYGLNEARRNPSRHGGVTAVAWFKRVADEAFFTGRKTGGPEVDADPRSWDCYPRRHWLGYAVAQVSFCAPNMVVVRKRSEGDQPPNTPAMPARWTG
jgi:hypothetical protein